MAIIQTKIKIFEMYMCEVMALKSQRSDVTIMIETMEMDVVQVV